MGRMTLYAVECGPAGTLYDEASSWRVALNRCAERALKILGETPTSPGFAFTVRLAMPAETASYRERVAAYKAERAAEAKAHEEAKKASARPCPECGRVEPTFSDDPERAHLTVLCYARPDEPGHLAMHKRLDGSSWCSPADARVCVGPKEGSA
jgi:hypothetical protein